MHLIDLSAVSTDPIGTRQKSKVQDGLAFQVITAKYKHNVSNYKNPHRPSNYLHVNDKSEYNALNIRKTTTTTSFVFKTKQNTTTS